MLTAVLQQQAALTRRSRRLHIGNLPPELTIDALRELFNTTMQAAKLAIDENPCVNDVNLSSDSRFAFVEFRSVLECSNALVLDGMQLLGKPLRVQRPNDFAAPPPGLDRVLIPQAVSSSVTSSNVSTTAGGLLGLAASPMGMGAMGGLASNPAAMQAALAAAGVSSVAPGTGSVAGLSGASLAAMSSSNPANTPGAAVQSNASSLTRRARRLHIGNLPLGVGLTGEMLKQFFNAALVSANLHDTSKEGDPAVDAMLGTEGKFGFVEFRTIAEATSCLALNNIELGGKQLRVERPRDYAAMPDTMIPDLKAAGLLGNTSVAPDGKDLLTEGSSMPNAATGGPLALTLKAGEPLSLPPLNVDSATPVVVLRNMINKDDASQPEEMSDILEDTKIECGKHGQVLNCVSPQLGTGGPPGSGYEVHDVELRVFVRFTASDAAIKCARELHGKQFDGKSVSASFLTEEKFALLQGLPHFSA